MDLITRLEEAILIAVLRLERKRMASRSIRRFPGSSTGPTRWEGFTAPSISCTRKASSRRSRPIRRRSGEGKARRSTATPGQALGRRRDQEAEGRARKADRRDAEEHGRTRRRNPHGHGGSHQGRPGLRRGRARRTRKVTAAHPSDSSRSAGSSGRRPPRL